MRISDWSSDVCSSDLDPLHGVLVNQPLRRDLRFLRTQRGHLEGGRMVAQQVVPGRGVVEQQHGADTRHRDVPQRPGAGGLAGEGEALGLAQQRSEEHTSELQSLMRRSYAVFRLIKQKKKTRALSTEVTIQGLDTTQLT